MLEFWLTRILSLLTKYLVRKIADNIMLTNIYITQDQDIAAFRPLIDKDPCTMYAAIDCVPMNVQT